MDFGYYDGINEIYELYKDLNAVLKHQKAEIAWVFSKKAKK